MVVRVMLVLDGRTCSSTKDLEYPLGQENGGVRDVPIRRYTPLYHPLDTFFVICVETYPRSASLVACHGCLLAQQWQSWDVVADDGGCQLGIIEYSIHGGTYSQETHGFRRLPGRFLIGYVHV